MKTPPGSVQMRLLLPPHLHWYLKEKQRQRRQRGLEQLSLSDIAVMLLNEHAMAEWQQQAGEEEEKEQLV